MPCKFESDKWVLVVDSKVDPENTANTLSAMKTHEIKPKGSIDCSVDDTPKPCSIVNKFPAWCHTEAGMCWFGSRTECEHFDELEKMAADTQHNK